MPTTNVPGVNINLVSTKTAPRSVGRYDAAYCLVSSLVNVGTDAPYFVRSAKEYSDTFGVTLSGAAISLYFEQNHGYGLFIMNVRPVVTRVFVVALTTVGAVATLTIDGMAFNATILAGDTQAAVVSRLATAINNSIPEVATITNGVLRTNAASVVGTGALTVSSSALDTYPIAGDVSHYLLKLPQLLPQGYVVAPEFFANFTDVNRQLLAQYMEAFCADPSRLWSYKVDSTLAKATGPGVVNKLSADRALFTSISGCGSYEAPWLRNNTGTMVAPSLAKIGIMLRRWRSEGFTQPGSGASIVVYGVTDTSATIEDPEQDILHPLGINVFRMIPYQAGIYSWGSRTMSTDPNWLWETTRVIMNSLANQLSAVVRGLVFTTTSNSGTTITVAKASMTATAAEYFRVGALWGADLSDGFQLVMDDTNNTPTLRDAGDLVIDCYVKPAPLVERVQLNITRVPLGLNFSDFISKLGNVEKPTTQSQTTTGATPSTGAGSGGSNAK
jgi:uncharacterized protein